MTSEHEGWSFDQDIISASFQCTTTVKYLPLTSRKHFFLSISWLLLLNIILRQIKNSAEMSKPSGNDIDFFFLDK